MKNALDTPIDSCTLTRLERKPSDCRWGPMSRFKSTPLAFRQPVFLTDRDQPLFRIRCPVHGFIHFSDNERAVIDHPLFRRLRWIKQLALTDLVYPGATH